MNQARFRGQARPIFGYPEWCREVAGVAAGELSVAALGSVLRRYSDACLMTAARKRAGIRARYPRRKHALVPLRRSSGTFQLRDQRLRLSVARGIPELWVRLARPVPYPVEKLRSVTLLLDAGQLVVDVTASLEVVEWAIERRVGTLVIGDPHGITHRDAGPVHNWRLRAWRRTHLMAAITDKAQLAGIHVHRVDERGASSTCPDGRARIPKPRDRNFFCPHCGARGHRDLIAARNIAALPGGGTPATSTPVLVEHRRVGTPTQRRDRRRHHWYRRRSCPAPGRPTTNSDGESLAHSTTQLEDQPTHPSHAANVG
jgi:hypothetical protein